MLSHFFFTDTCNKQICLVECYNESTNTDNYIFEYSGGKIIWLYYFLR